jgi:GTP-binding protein
MTAPDAETPEDDGLAALTRDLFAGDTRFLLGATSIAALPVHTDVEVAFAGRSNVGKSSLLNALVGRQNMARTSKEPGRTRELNFFLIDGKNDRRAMIADLPGYGYAKAPKDVVARWTRLTKSYLAGRPNLRRVFLLIDSRHGIKNTDADILELLDKSAVSYQVILTKSDKITKTEMTAAKEQVLLALAKHPAAYPEIIVTSSLKSDGIDDVRRAIGSLVQGN